MEKVNTKHIPVPVEVAKKIAEDYKKSIVVILSFDPVSRLTHITTYGNGDLKIKNLAALWGEVAIKAIGADLTKKHTYEDFRTKKKGASNSSQG